MVQVAVEDRTLLEIDTLMLAVVAFEDQPLDDAVRLLDQALGGLIGRLTERKEITGKRNTVTVIHTAVTGATLRAERVAVVGAGKRERFDLEAIRVAGAAAARKAQELRLTRFALAPAGLLSTGLDAQEVGQALAEGIALALYRYDRFKSLQEDGPPPEVERVSVVHSEAGTAASLRAGIEAGERLAAAVMTARDLATGPANVVTATHLGDRASELARRHGFSAQVFDKTALERMGCGGILAVNGGSVEPPVMGVLRYEAGRTGAKTLAVVGKGITFDSGGISLKPAENMHYMRHDKSGACAVIGFLQAAATLGLPVNVLGVFAATDNMPGGGAYRPGDVIKTYSGRNAEILNTDAEGRVILSDALAYAAEQRPDAIVDLATLTGACVVALGHVCSGLFSTRDELAAGLEQAGVSSGERLWRMPLWDEYREQIKAPLGDLKNTGGRPAGAITAAWFLADFVGDIPWAHLDIAGTAWAQKAWPVLPPYVQSDLATGVGVRLLTYFVKTW
jgi:leucyl aminopeptidase